MNKLSVLKKFFVLDLSKRLDRSITVLFNFSVNVVNRILDQKEV